jgi:tetratricopeptide (TPR) repeat protein
VIELPEAPRRRRFRRVLAAWAVPTAGALFVYLYAAPLLERWHVPELLSVVGGLVIVSILLLPAALLATARRSSDYALTRIARPVLVASACAASVAIADVLIDASGVSPPFGGIVGWAGVSAAVVWAASFQHARESRRAPSQRLLKAERPEDAIELAAHCRHALEDGQLEPEERAMAELNLAGALIALSARADQDDVLQEAVAILDDAISSSPAPLSFEAAAQLVEAMRVKEERTGDDVGYDRALELLAEAAERASVDLPDAVGRALAARAERYARLAAREDRSEEAERLHALAVAEQQRAVAATPDEVDSHAGRTAALARLAASYPLDEDLDAAIRMCRSALRGLRSSHDPERAATMLTLADLLELRAVLEPEGGLGQMLDRLWPGRPRGGVVKWLWPDRATNDLARAFVLCMRASLESKYAAEARARLPHVRDLLIEANRIKLPRVSERQTGWMYSHVVREQAGISGSAAGSVAARWADWAAARGDEQQAADAWWYWVTSIAADLRRRVVRDKQHRISNIQGVVVKAADALLRAGRLRDAAVALDLGRAVLLTERMQRDRDDLEPRLVAAGRPELATQWRASGQLIERTDREAFERVSSDPAADARLGSAEYFAMTGLERLLREISRIPGFEDVDALPDYDDLREAASEGPLVYMAAGEDGGFGLVLTDAPEPALVRLPALDRRTVGARAEELIAADGAPAIARALEDLLPELRSHAICPLAAHLPPGSLVTLVPLGALAELPIHMAGAERDDDGVWRDGGGGTVFRYAPNARVLLRAQRTARALAREEPSLLTACVPDAPGLPRLRRAVAESEGVAASFAQGRAERPRPATVASVRRCLDTCSIWHFACHGVHNPLSPLDSALELADGPLTLRAMFASTSAKRRLAVLSACETAAVDASVLDEVVGFPGAMLQSGVAGVVSCDAAVDDDAAALLVLAFFARLEHADSPARALAAAQAWLRSATNSEIHAEFPTAHERPEDGRSDLTRWLAHRPFADPSSWALFSYTGA